MSYVKAEIIKIVKDPLLWILSLVYFVIFYVLVISSLSGIHYGKITAFAMSSYVLFIFGFGLNCIYAVLVGTHVVGKEFSERTILFLVQNEGRYRSILAKIMTVFIVDAFFVLLLTFFGFGIGIVNQVDFGEFVLEKLFEQFSIVFVGTFLLSLFSMTVTIMIKNEANANIICVALCLGQTFLPKEISRLLCHLSPTEYLSSQMARIFGELQKIYNVKLTISNQWSTSENMLFLSLYTVICVVIQFMIAKKREYV